MGTTAKPERPQIKSRERVRDLAEVFTNKREVDAMLDMIPDMFDAGPDKKFLEPACGNGNFLVEILARKLAALPEDGYDFGVARAVASIYGVDIDASNVTESRERMLEVVRQAYVDTRRVHITYGLTSVLQLVLSTNIVLGDFLADTATLEVVDYEVVDPYQFRRVWYHIDGSPALLEDGSIRADPLPIPFMGLAV